MSASKLKIEELFGLSYTDIVSGDDRDVAIGNFLNQLPQNK